MVSIIIVFVFLDYHVVGLVTAVILLMKHDTKENKKKKKDIPGYPFSSNIID
jgi:hypothetical protein